MYSNPASLENLTLVKGIGYEGIIEILEREGVSYSVEEEPRRRKKGRFFRESLVKTSASQEQLRELLGHARSGKFHYLIYHALYEIDLQSFDITTLDKLIDFDKGRLKETIYVLYDKDNN